MKERYLSKTPFLTFVYLSKCNIKLQKNLQLNISQTTESVFVWTLKMLLKKPWRKNWTTHMQRGEIINFRICRQTLGPHNLAEVLFQRERSYVVVEQSLFWQPEEKVSLVWERDNSVHGYSRAHLTLRAVDVVLLTFWMTADMESIFLKAFLFHLVHSFLSNGNRADIGKP